MSTTTKQYYPKNCIKLAPHLTHNKKIKHKAELNQEKETKH